MDIETDSYNHSLTFFVHLYLSEVAANMAQTKALLRESQDKDIEMYMLPQFVSRPRDQLNIMEGKQVHFAARLEQIIDPHLHVEWLKNGKEIIVSHRFRPIHDFGYVALDICNTIPEDSGVYTCKATNLAGSAECQVTLLCKGMR